MDLYCPYYNIYVSIHIFMYIFIRICMVFYLCRCPRFRIYGYLFLCGKPQFVKMNLTQNFTTPKSRYIYI